MVSPTVTLTERKLTVKWSDRPMVRRPSFECVVDWAGLGELIGVEILFFRQQLGAVPPARANSGGVTWSYDEEEDAFYLRLAQGTAPRQQSAKGVACVDGDDLLLAMDIDL